MRKSLLLIVLFAVITILISYTSCTYDYFEDETNYIVFVPEVYDRTVRDCRVMVYDAAGTLVGEKYGETPFDKDPRIQIGQFGFRLQPGEYKVYCYTNTDSLSFTETRSFEQSSFKMNLKEDGETYMQPSDVYFDKLAHTVIHPAFLNVDTANVRRYTGRITVRFKNFPKDISKFKKVNTLARGIGTMQYLKLDTLTTRVTEFDAMTHNSDVLPSVPNFDFEVENRFFPSIEDELTEFELEFLDSNNERVEFFPLPIADYVGSERIPRRLLHGQRMIIEVDTWFITKISVVDWDADVQEEDVNMQ